MENKTNIHGQRIAALRKRLGWSRFKLAVYFGKTERTICRYEKGEGVPRADFMDKIKELENGTVQRGGES